MRLTPLLASLALSGHMASAVQDANADMAAQSPNDLMAELQQMATNVLEEAEQGAQPRGDGRCSLFTAQVRQDWENMSKPMRRDYVRSVQCLFDSPSKLTKYGWAARTRYDDFVAVHANMTRTVHNTANFLGWHRYYVHAYETALRDECGYQGYSPYWNWFKYQDDFRKSPLFDGSDTSMGADGEYLAHEGTKAGVLGIPVGSGYGGGCIKEGPFKGQEVRLGPILPPYPSFPTGKDLFDENPHCIRRDLNSYVALNYMKTEQLYNITLGAASGTIKSFQEEFQGGMYPNSLGIHAAGHFVLGGDGGDLFASPNDPVFFLHHGMVDRVWWIWQALHPDQAATISGTITMNNSPPSRNGTVDDELDLLGLLPPVPLKEMLNTIRGGPLCYVYL